MVESPLEEGDLREDGEEAPRRDPVAVDMQSELKQIHEDKKATLCATSVALKPNIYKSKMTFLRSFF